MKSMVWAAMVLLTAAWLDAADHPTVLLVRHGGKELPVVGVKGTDPVIKLDGREKRISDNPPLSAERAPYFADGFVELSDVRIDGVRTTVATPGAVNDDVLKIYAINRNFFSIDLQPTAEVRGGFIAIITFAPEFVEGTTEQSSAQIVVHDLPTLPAGVKTHVEFVNPGTAGRQYIPLVFAAGGAELKTSAAPLIAEYFSRIERLRLAAAVAKYRDSNRDKDHAATPVLQIRPTLPKDTAAPKQAITATLSVREDGVVAAVAVAGTDDPRLEASIRDSMSGWLFLPRLEAGAPTSARVAVPLTFAAPEKR